MIIKDKITPEIKDELKELIRVSGIIGKEVGILLCKDNKGNIFLSKDQCVGDLCRIKLGELKCPSGSITQGDFHTHPYIRNIKEGLKEFPDIKSTDTTDLLTDKFIKNIFKKQKAITTPSHADLLATVIRKYGGVSSGTTCVGNDIRPNTIECWTITKKIKKQDYDRAIAEVNKSIAGKLPQDWIKSLFTIEKIRLDR